MQSTASAKHHGAPDEYVTVAQVAYFALLRAAGNDVEVTEYADAPYSYDNPLSSMPLRLSKGSEHTPRYSD